MSDVTHSSPFRFSPDVELIPDDEAATIKGLREQVKAIQDKTTAAYGTAVRAIHAKGHAIVGGTLQIFLGSINRSCRPVYERSVAYRGSRNGCPIVEPRLLACRIKDDELGRTRLLHLGDERADAPQRDLGADLARGAGGIGSGDVVHGSGPASFSTWRTSSSSA